MLPHLVLIEQAVSRLFSICKHCDKVGGRGGTRYSCDIWPQGDRLICHGQSGGTTFEGGLSTARQTQVSGTVVQSMQCVDTTLYKEPYTNIQVQSTLGNFTRSILLSVAALYPLN